MVERVYITKVEEKVSQKGNKFNWVTLLSPVKLVTQRFMGDADLKALGFKETMLSDTASGKLVAVDVDFDVWGNVNRVTKFSQPK